MRFPRLDLVFQRGEAHPYHHWFGQGKTTPHLEAQRLAEYFKTGRISYQPYRPPRPADKPICVDCPRPIVAFRELPKGVTRKVKQARKSRVIGRRRD